MENNSAGGGRFREGPLQGLPPCSETQTAGEYRAGMPAETESGLRGNTTGGV
jgi:hypothetical protein